MIKKITEKRLYNITLAYLSRFDASAGKVRDMLNRRLIKARFAEADIPSDAPLWIEHIIDRMKTLGYLNDARYAENQVRLLSSQGKSHRFIMQKLLRDGIDADMINSLAECTDTTESDRAALFVKRKKMGCFRPENQRRECYRKDLAALARAGFSYDIAKQALHVDAPDDEDIYSC